MVCVVVQLNVVLVIPTSLSHVDMASQSTHPSGANPVPQELTNNDLAFFDTHRSSAVEVINRHSTALTTAIGVDLVYFSNKFIEIGFVTRQAADDILNILGIRNQEKGRQLLNLVITNCNISLDQKKWFDKFVGVFSSEAAYKDLVTSMTEDFSTGKHSSCGPSPLCLDTPPQPVLGTVSPLTTTQTSASSSINVLASSEHSLHTLRTDPAMMHASPSHAAHPPLTNQFLPHPSMQPHMPIPHPPYYPSMIPSQYLPQYLPQHNPVPASCVFPPQTSQSLGVQSYASNRSSQVDWDTPIHVYPTHYALLQSAPYPSPATMTSCPIQHSIPSQYSSPVNSSIMQVVNQFIDYVKTIYRTSEVERDTRVVKWPPTPSTVYINLACINRENVSGKSREYAEITEAMVRHGNVDVIRTKKGPIEFNEIARGISIPIGKLTHSKQAIQQKRVILVEGAPGVGKSTFAREFCRRWERGKIAQQYQLVLLLRLRDDRISKAKSLKDLIYHPLEGVARAVSEELILSYNFHTLIILEGFDELPDHCRDYRSIFFQLIAGELLPLATVLVTSRPWATERIRCNYENRIYQHIEILGFTSQQITEYIERTLLQDSVSDMKAYLEKHPQIRMGMYIPLNSAIVVTVYQESLKSGCALPTTLTELYTAMARTLLLRYLRGSHEHESVRMHTFDDLPPAVYTKFFEVCRLAYSAICGTSDQVQLIFTGLPTDFDSLGLMDSVTELYVTQGTVSSHNFLHLTFQEYFAAVHISNLSLAEQLEHFKRHEEGRLKAVLRFLAGLNKLNCFSRQSVHHFLTPSLAENSSPYSIRIDADVATDPVNWMFEAQSSDVIALLLEKKTIKFSVSQSMLPLDHYGLGYCIAHSQCQWVLSSEAQMSDLEIGQLQNIGLGQIDGRHDNIIILAMSEEDMRMLGAGANTTEQPSGRVIGLRGGELQPQGRVKYRLEEGRLPDRLVHQRRGGYAVSVEVLNMLWTEWKSVLNLHELALRQPLACGSITWPDLSALRVLNLNISGNTSWRLDSLLPHLSLESLTLALNEDSENVGLMVEDCVAIGNHITTATYLKELCFIYRKGAILTHSPVVDIREGLEAIIKALTGNHSLPLEGLEFEWRCTFTDTAADCLAQFISNTTTLQYLRIWWCTVSAHGLLELAKAIHNNSTLQEKNLEDFTCTVNGDDEAEDFVQLLVEYPQVVGQYKTDTLITQISNAGAVALAQALRQNSTLNGLNLSNNSISNAGAVALGQALCCNSTLEELHLSNNSISDAGAVALGQALHHNSTLMELVLSNNSISNTGVVAIAEALHHNSTLKYIYFSNNSISDAGVVAIAKALRHNSTLKYIYLSNNSIGDAGVVAIADALHHNSALKYIYLSNNSISDAGAIALARGLRHNSTLWRLNLSGNNGIGEEGTRKLIPALDVNRSMNGYMTTWGCLVLPKRCEECATQCELYETVRHSILYD